MKYIITESQYRYIKEGEYSPQLSRRYSMIENWLEENLPMIDFSYYDIDGGDDYLLVLLYVINLFLEQVGEYDYLFDGFHNIPQQDIIDYMMINFKDMIIDYLKEG